MLVHRSLLLATLLLQGITAAPQASRFTYYPLLTPLSGPCDLTTGPDGAIWSSNILQDTIARVEPATGIVTEYTIPYSRAPVLRIPEIAGRGALACVIQPGEDGMLYAASGIRNQLVRIDPWTKEIQIFTPPDGGELPGFLGNLQPFNDMWRGPEGIFYTQTTANLISHFDYKTEQFKNFLPPTPLSGPLGIYVASDKGVWFCEFLANKIGRLNATDGTFIEYPLPLSLSQPAVMRAETEGKYLWFTAFVGNSIGRINMFTGEVKSFPSPSILSFPTEDTVDSDGNIWFSTATRNSLHKLTPSTGKVESVTQPGTLIVAPISVPPAVDIAIHYGPGNAIWFTEVATNRIGKYQL